MLPEAEIAKWTYGFVDAKYLRGSLASNRASCCRYIGPCWAGDCTTLTYRNEFIPYWIEIQGDWLLVGEDLFPLTPEQK